MLKNNKKKTIGKTTGTRATWGINAATKVAEGKKGNKKPYKRQKSTIFYDEYGY